MKKIGGSTNHSVGSLMSFALVGLFAILSMLLAVIGIDAYQSIVDATQNTNDARASMSYITNKVRSSDYEDNVSIAEREGVRMLVIGQDEYDPSYKSCIYFYEGELMEQFYDPDEEFYPEDGRALVELEDLHFYWQENGMLLITVITRDGTPHNLYIGVRSRTDRRGGDFGFAQAE